MKRKEKKGVASFYIVAFSTLILIIIAASFAAVIISEVTRTGNDDLAQSAYDSALAGVEDAKLAFYNYQSCMGSAPVEPNPSVGGINCSEIVYIMERQQDCDMVARILGRIGKTDSGEVLIQESVEDGNNMQQAYTCVKVTDTLGDYRGSLSSTNAARVVRAKFDTAKGVHARDIDSVKISWYSDANASAHPANYASFSYASGSNAGEVKFPRTDGVSGVVPTPAVISVGLVQTHGSGEADSDNKFSLDEFDTSRGEQTNRGMVYLVPSNSSEGASKSGSTYNGAYNDGARQNVIPARAMVKSNDKTNTNGGNLPYVVYCDDLNDYLCSATIKLPEAVGGGRNDDTFLMVVTLPYGKPNTDFVMEFYCKDGTVCSKQQVVDDEGKITEEDTNRAELKWVQIGVDSTGRANDLYRRVETRLEGGNGSAISTMGVLEILGGDKDHPSIEKNFSVTSEHNF